ncbi:DeoR family transcriptional regulator [Vibrio cholerae]|uniref:transcriptional repressor AgaR n=1 Tax=Vibrio paracholerae TaxID=650003 RepID=UPI000D36C93C|nr:MULTISPECIES: transcriptional repressor AgaR [Vibrio]MBN7280059.1 DeoR family transcriptional regulator [Vibrio paracholerae]MBN7283447.1 DeoR family transcriptional regulator [Vibrio paracholerae]PUA70735.1 DeoR family transcriptional regulator [Vibrio cholerae]
MTSTQRRDAILKYIQHHQSGSVNYFAEQFQVSEVTIRHDLNILEKKGCVTRCHGGALINAQFAFDQPLQDKKQLNQDIKSQLGAYAASLVEDGDTLILDSGSTTEQIAFHLTDKKQLKVMTNAINIAYHLANHDNIEVIVTGGLMRKNSYSLHGDSGESLLGQFRFNKLFLGVDGFDKLAGVTTPHAGEASINRRMVDAAQIVIAVTDSSKFNRQSFCLIARPEQLDMLITDSGIPEDYRRELTAMGVDVRIVDAY